VWQSNSAGALRLVQREGDGLQSLHALTITPDGNELLTLNRKSGGVIRWRIDRESGRLTEPVQVVKVPEPMSMVVKYL
jgi:6-phosphogluconolactonase (cycloisomerase 2 family)